MYNYNEKISSYYNTFCLNKKYLILYVVLILILSPTMMLGSNYAHPVMEIGIIALTLILGIFSIIYYFRHDNELYKVAFVIIICFGLICAFLTPMGVIPDEGEHFIRSELTSDFNLFPHPVSFDNTYGGDQVNGLTFRSIESAGLISNSYGETVFSVDFDNKPINYTIYQSSSAFMQNPFFGYLAQGIGIFLAKLLDLSAIWMLWLGRIGNLVLYAFLIRTAIKKSPILKIPLIAIACLPLVILQSASVSIDVMINGLAFIIIAYFFYMLKSDENSLDLKDIGIFSALVLLVTLCKLPYLGFILLLLFIPKSKFKTPFYYRLISVILVIALSILWSKFYALPNYNYSYRVLYFTQNNISLAGQITYMQNHLLKSFVSISHFLNYLGFLLEYYFKFSIPPYVYESGVLSCIGPLFLGALIFLYPNEYELSLKSRIEVLLTIFIIYMGICMIQLLTWSPVGELFSLDIQARYFIPLLALCPFVFGINNHVKQDKKINSLIMIITITFLAMICILTAATFY